MRFQEPQAIVAAFESREDAENAVRELIANNFDESCIDITTTEGVRFDSSDELAEDHDHIERTLVTVRDPDRLTQAAALMEGCGGYCDPRATGSWEAVKTDPGPGQTADQMGLTGGDAIPLGGRGLSSLPGDEISDTGTLAEPGRFGEQGFEQSTFPDAEPTGGDFGRLAQDRIADSGHLGTRDRYAQDERLGLEREDEGLDEREDRFGRPPRRDEDEGDYAAPL